jgi:excinuclease ABC subunit B
VNSKVILYADTVTPAMRLAIDETLRRRGIQIAYNTEHGITAKTVIKSIHSSLETEMKARRTVAAAVKESEQELDQTEIIKLLEEEMLTAATNLEFERAAQLRDKINEMKGAPTVTSGDKLLLDPAAEPHKIWQPKSKGRGGGKRKVAK